MKGTLFFLCSNAFFWWQAGLSFNELTLRRCRISYQENVFESCQVNFLKGKLNVLVEINLKYESYAD